MKTEILDSIRTFTWVLALRAIVLAWVINILVLLHIARNLGSSFSLNISLNLDKQKTNIIA